MFENLLQNGRADKSPPVNMDDGSPGFANPSPKKLRWLMDTTEHVLMTITPALAQEMLAYNDSNRPLSPNRVKLYARQMLNGEWRLTKQPIIFSKSHKLQDGQHRLRACLDSGMSIRAWVDFGDEDENFAFIDVGKPRGASDIFAINGVKCYTAMAAAARWIMAYDKGALAGGQGGLSFSPTPRELLAYYHGLQGIERSLPVFDAFAESRIASPSAMMAMHYLCARKNRGHADAFFTKVGTGVGFTDKQEPAYKLHKRLIENLTGAERIKPLIIAAYTIKAWNAFRTGKPVGLLRWRGEQKPDESFPKVI